MTAGALPPGLSLNPSTGVIAGLIGGTPTSAGTFNFTVRAANAAAPAIADTKSFTITVIGLLAIATNSLPNASVGANYNQPLTAIGGLGALVWSLAPGSGPLPTGLTLSGAGVLSGVPSASGSFSFIIQVADSSSPRQIATKSFGIVVSPAGGPNLVFVAQPTDTLPGEVIAPAVQVRVQDNSGAPIAGFVVSLAFGCKSR
ncbi:MAG: Ig domain-containing protein [Bryobacteraceae bacterium]